MIRESYGYWELLPIAVWQDVPARHAHIKQMNDTLEERAKEEGWTTVGHAEAWVELVRVDVEEGREDEPFDIWATYTPVVEADEANAVMVRLKKTVEKEA